MYNLHILYITRFSQNFLYLSIYERVINYGGNKKRSGADASHLIVEGDTIKKQPVAEIEVRPEEQSHISLGEYTSADPPNGFTIHISPDPEPDAIVTKITRLGNDTQYELVLHIANYGSKTMSMEVWQL